jgi:prolyl oligopeptidase
VQGFDARTGPIGDDGATVWALTDLDAPRGRIVAINPLAPARAHWREIVPESENAIQGADEVGGKLVVQYLRDAHSLVRVFDRGGALLGEVELPGLGTAGGFSGDREDADTFYSFTGTTQPTAIYRLDLATLESSLYRRSPLAFEPEDYLTEQVFYTSSDGTRVPMFLTRKATLPRDGHAPTYLYGYGGFGVSITPTFSVPNLVWLEQGGLLAIPNLRGGGEYGEEWHEAGTKLAKQNVFDDFIAAAEWLIANGWTSSERLAIGGRSNGGLLVGACMTQRPELYRAALPAVGVLDMLRYHEFTIGWAWAGDYGTSDDPAQFRALRAYSPLHNVRPGTRYPATLVTTADHDDRVVPAHSYKFTAALQAAQAGADPILIRIDTRAGHGGGKPTAMLIEEWADCWAFLARELGME